jgi:hypothetical protein
MHEGPRGNLSQGWGSQGSLHAWGLPGLINPLGFSGPLCMGALAGQGPSTSHPSSLASLHMQFSHHTSTYIGAPI